MKQEGCAVKLMISFTALLLTQSLLFGQAARYIENGVLKNDLDANNKKILNLDTSNLAIGGGLPTQTGHAGQHLITNGTIASWAAIIATVAWDDITGKPSTFPPSTHTHTFASLTSKPTTIAGYGIADAFTQGTADLLYSPLGHVHAYSALTGLPTLGTAAALNVAASGDAASGEVMKGNDSRNTNARTPTAHHTTHSTGGTDAIAPADIGAQVAGSYVNANGAITGATKTKITYDAKGLVTSGTDATTADIADSTNKRYVTDAQQTVIGNTSGTNTGDNAVNSLYSGLVSNATHTGDVTGATALTLATAQPAVHTWALAQTFTVAPVFTDQSGTQTALGLGTLATQSGTFSGTSSGTNTGDNAVNSLYSGLVSDTAYDATSWDGVTTVAPSKNAVRDKFESLTLTTAWGTITGTLNDQTDLASEIAARANQDLSNLSSVNVALGNLGFGDPGKSFVTLTLDAPLLQSYARFGTDGSVAYRSYAQVLSDIGAQPADADLTTWAGITPGTGVGTALGVNVGSAGAFTTNNAANTFTAGQTISGASLTLSGNQSAAAWTTSGLRLIGVAGTLTDTTSSGTVATAYTNKLGGNTIAASSATTFTNYISGYFSDPVAGTNVTMTNKYALGADSLRVGTSNALSVSNAGILTLAVAPVFTDQSGTRTALGLGTLATQSGTFSGTSSGTNTGDQTNITGNAATVTTNANLTGHVTSTGNAAVLGSFTFAQMNTAISDADAARTDAANSFTGVQTFSNQILDSYTSTASTPAAYLTGSWLTGGTGTTNFPHLFLQATGTTASTTWSTAGTALGINAVRGFTGNLIDSKLAGASTSAFKVSSTGAVALGTGLTLGLTYTGTISSTAGADLYLDVPAGRNIFLTANGTAQTPMAVANLGVGFGSTVIVGWANNTAASATSKDTGLYRNAAGVVEVNNGTAGTFADIKARKLIADNTVTGAGTTGAQTINKMRGTVRFAAAASTLVVTDSLVTSTSKIIARGIGAFDTTATNFQCAAASGSFTITANAAATAETEVAFDVLIP